MSADVLWVLGYVLVGLAFGAVVLLLDSLLLGLANRFTDRSTEYYHRVGTQIPRVLQ